MRATTDDDGHYFSEIMKKVYAEALNAPRIRGKRVHDVRSESLIRAVSTMDGPYMKIKPGISKAYNSMFKTTTGKLWDELNAVFERTQHDVNQVCSTKEDDTPAAKKMREELLARLPDARDRLENGIWKELERCKQGRSQQG